MICPCLQKVELESQKPLNLNFFHLLMDTYWTQGFKEWGPSKNYNNHFNISQSATLMFTNNCSSK